MRLKGRFVKTWAFEVETFFGFNVFRGFFSLPFLPLRELGFAFILGLLQSLFQPFRVRGSARTSRRLATP